MEKAIEHAGITKESVDYINTHGTSTGMGDPIETNAIAEFFSEHAGEMAVTSTKGSNRTYDGVPAVSPRQLLVSSVFAPASFHQH